MSTTDAEFTREGWTLRCTEVIDNRCATHQWFEEWNGQSLVRRAER